MQAQGAAGLGELVLEPVRDRGRDGREVDLLSRAGPAARDAFLEAESRYRGGAATSLEVLDAYSSAVDAAVRFSDAVARYRIARAIADRWGSP